MEFRPGQDIFSSNAECIINPVNCVGVMGAGLARAFAKRYPAILHPYKRVCADRSLKPGGAQLIRLDRETGRRSREGNLLVANIATKDHWRDPSRIEWVESGVKKLAKALEDRGVKSVAVPKLGAGLGGLSWDEVRPVIEKHFAGPASRGMKVIVLGEGPAHSRSGQAEKRAEPQVLNFSTLGRVPEGAVYIGRNPRIWTESGQSGWPKWGNPFERDRDGAKEEVIRKYENWIDRKLADPAFRKEFVDELSGKDQVCHCAPAGCHGHVNMKKLKEIERGRDFSGPVAASARSEEIAAEEQARSDSTSGSSKDLGGSTIPVSHRNSRPDGFRAYAGIGARDTPPEILKKMEDIGEEMARRGYALRSGAAPGADSAFEQGCDRAGGEKEIFLPWPGYEDRKADGKQVFHHDLSREEEIAARYHPAWDRLKRGARALMARNANQMMGQDLASPSKVVVCYTKGGETKGGTGQSMRMAADMGIPVINLGAERWHDFGASQIAAAAEVLGEGKPLILAMQAARSESPTGTRAEPSEEKEIRNRSRSSGYER